MHHDKMLPRNLPKFGNFLVNTATKLSRIELEVQVHKPRFGFQRNVFAFENTLVRRLGWIIPLDSSIANALLGNQFERRLKEIDVQP
jgi:hypothetical protein